ncbi:MAG: WYL domain-containing protein [Planctomycetota bacterium]
MNLSLETVLRCLDLVPLVRENPGIKLAELSKRSGFSEKTIVDQLIPTLMLCGAPPYMPHDYVSIWMEGDEVHCSFADHFKRPVTLLPIEITALHLALASSWFPGGRDARVEARISALREKIEKALPEQQRVFLRESERVSIDDNPEASSPILALLKIAIAKRHKAEIAYLSGGEDRLRVRIVHPQGIVVQNGVTYVPSWDQRRGHTVSFRLDRIDSAQLLEETFEADPDFDLEEFTRAGIFSSRGQDETEVVIKATGASARHIAETLDQTQWSWDKKGETLTLTLSTSRPKAIARYLLTLGPEAFIESPGEYRSALAAEIKRLQDSLG